MSGSIIVDSLGLTPEKIFGWFFGRVRLLAPYITEYYISIVAAFLLMIILRIVINSLGFAKSKAKKITSNILGFVDLKTNIGNFIKH